MSSSKGTFVADNAYASNSEGDLSFEAGDEIEVLVQNNEGESWFGICSRTNEEGWFSPMYGHVLDYSALNNPYVDMTDDEKLAKRKEIFLDIVSHEKKFVGQLDQFIKLVVGPLLSRDTDFKRKFLAEPSIAVTLTLLKEIFAASFTFYSSLKNADSGVKLAQSYQDFAPSLQIFTQYATENAACLNAVKSFGRQFREFAKENSLPDGTMVEPYLLSPLNHCKY